MNEGINQLIKCSENDSPAAPSKKKEIPFILRLNVNKFNLLSKLAEFLMTEIKNVY